MSDLITIQQAVDNFKSLIEDAIRKGGIKAKEAIIRSSRPINNIHGAVKADFIRNGISRDRIHPPLGESKRLFRPSTVEMITLVMNTSMKECVYC